MTRLPPVYACSGGRGVGQILAAAIETLLLVLLVLAAPAQAQVTLLSESIPQTFTAGSLSKELSAHTKE